MKTNDLQKTLGALDIAPIKTPLHQQTLKHALVHYEAPRQTLAMRLQATAKTIVGVPMSHKKLFASVSSLALIAILAVSITAYNYGHSPRAEAEQLVNRGLTFVHTIGSDQMDKIQAQLGGDPVKELEEAKKAKDLTVLTPEEFQQESAKHRGMAMSSLGKDGPQYGSVGISANGDLPTIPPTDADAHYVTGGPVGEGVSTMTAVGRGVARISDDAPSNEAGNQKVLEFHAAAGTDTAGVPAVPADFQPVKPSKYLRYTNSTGHVVVLGLDEKGVPINKTIFMSDEDIENMQKPNLDVKQ